MDGLQELYGQYEQEGPVKDAKTVEGRCFYAQSNPAYAHVWSVYDKGGKYVESFGGSILAAQERIKALDFDTLIRKWKSVGNGSMKDD